MVIKGYYTYIIKNKNKMSKVDFLISYEHKSRELESILLIKKELEGRGYTVQLHGLYDKDFCVHQPLKKVNPKVIVVPAAYDLGIISCFAYNLAGLNNKIVNLQWEQVLSLKEEADEQGYHNPKGLAKQVVHLCWGSNTLNRLLKGGVDPKKVFVTGPVHLDLLRPDFNKYFLTRKELSSIFNLNDSKDWILFVSSFSYCTISETQLQTIADSYGIDDTTYFKNFSLQSKEQILSWFELLLEKGLDKILIYRPHPDEVGRDSRLIELERKYPNFRVISDYPLKHWVKAADNIFNWYSTSMADIFFLNKPCQILRPVKIRAEQEVAIFKNARFITQYKDFENCVNGDSTFCMSLDSEVIKGYYKFDAKPCFLNVCDVLEKVYSSTQYDIKISLDLKIKDFINRFKVPIGNYIFSHIPKDSILINFSFVRRRIENRQKIAEWYKKAYSKSVASEKEILDIEARFEQILSK